MSKFIAVLTLLATALGAGAQTAATLAMNPANVREMSLKDCVQISLQHNFDVQIQRYNPIIQLGVLNQAYGGYDPTFNISGRHNHNEAVQYTQVTGLNSNVTGVFLPSISDENSFNSDINGATTPWGLQYDIFGNVAQTTQNTVGSLEQENSGGQVGVTLTQPLLKDFWIDTTRLAILVGKNNLQQSEQELRMQFITTVAAVQNAYYELIYAQDNVKVQQQALALAETQLDQDRQRVQVGSMAPLDVQQDESQVASSEASLILARNALSIDQNMLKNLLTDNYLQWHPISIQPTETLTADLQLFNLQDCWGKGMTKRPDLLQARLEAQQQGITLKFDRNQLFPELDLNGQYGYNGEGRVFSDTFSEYGQANQPFYYYGASLSIPLSNVKARNALKSDKATLRQKLLTLKQLEQTIMVAIDNAVQQVAADYQGVQASKQARIYAAAALDAEQKKYDVGKSTTFTVLQLQNTLTTDRGAEIRSIANYDEDIARLAQQEGTTLDELNIEMEAK